MDGGVTNVHVEFAEKQTGIRGPGVKSFMNKGARPQRRSCGRRNNQIARSLKELDCFFVWFASL